MMIHQATRNVRAALLEGGHDARVLVGATFARMRTSVEGKNQGTTRDRVANEAGEQRIPGEITEQRMELAGQTDGRRMVVRRHTSLAGNVLVQLLAPLARQPSSQPGHNHALDLAAHLENLPRLVDARHGDEGAAIAHEINQPLARQPYKRCAYQCSACRERVADSAFGELRPGTQRVLDDRLAKTGIHGLAAIYQRCGRPAPCAVFACGQCPLLATIRIQ